MKIIITILVLLGSGAGFFFGYYQPTQLAELRDQARIYDIQIMESNIGLYYQDESEYPNKIEFESSFLRKGPQSKNCKTNYIYEVYDDEQHDIPNQKYKISICVESKHFKQKAKDDGGDDPKRLEVGFFTK